MRGLSCPAELKSSEIAAGLRAEERADRLPLMGTAPPVHRGGQVNSRLTLPPSTIQTDLARHPAAIGLARVLQPAEDSLMQTQSKNDSEQIQTHAFIRLASENCRAIILALPDSGNLCRLDIISSATFKALNRCARQKLVLEVPATNSDIRGVTGDSLKILGQVKGGMKFHLQGTAGALHLQVLVSSNFTGQHLNLSQRTMARLEIQLHPNLQDGGVVRTTAGQAPLVRRGGLYSLSYVESPFKRISIFRYKNGWLYKRWKNSGQLEKHGNGQENMEVEQLSISDRRGLKALGLENSMLKTATEGPLILTSDGFLQPHHNSTPYHHPKFLTKTPI